jgi:hypothetical protein
MAPGVRVAGAWGREDREVVKNMLTPIILFFSPASAARRGARSHPHPHAHDLPEQNASALFT